MLPYRQVHIDFHTSEAIEGIGSRFSKEQFIAALKEGHVNSVTLKSKCHHGWAYHPTKVNRQHPHLDFDLLGTQLEACREAGIRAKVYISAGLDQKYAVEHVEHLRTDKEGKRGNFLNPGYKRLCFGTPYLDQLIAEIEEVMQLYGDQADGIFLDIVGIGRCYCQHCIKGMLEAGLDPKNDADADEYARRVYLNYVARVRTAVDKYVPGLSVIHNDGGAIFQGHEIFDWNNGHVELESLPTGGWGYDHFPMSAAYARTFNKEFLGMTGKFHSSWGEFGGFKHPNALRFEAALANACGARCSIGDQLHPDGEMDMATYRLIGAAYKEVEEREPWLYGSTAVADVALLTVERRATHKDDALVGANRMMLEGHYLYNIIDEDCDFTDYKLLILPDDVKVTGEIKAKLDRYLSGGGKLLLSGRSGTDENGDFTLDFGVRATEKNELCPTYLSPDFDLEPNGRASYVMYSSNYKFELSDSFDGIVTAYCVAPYFNRDYTHFCSHKHTPYDRKATSPAAVVSESIGYIGWNIFREYAEQGSLHLRNMVFDTIERLIGSAKTLSVGLPSCGITTLMKQNGRLVHHLVYGIATPRGKGVYVIEDLPDVLNTVCALRTDKKPARVYLAPDMTDLPFTYADGTLTYTVPRFSCSTMVVIE